MRGATRRSGATTTTSCPRGVVQFVDNGCCRFVGFGTNARLQGALTEAECLARCNIDPTCIAADVRYPDINMVLEENVTYVCFNFYGTGLGFTTACGTDEYNERCYKKECLDVTTTTTTCAKGGLEFVDNGCCRYQQFSGTTARYRGSRTEADCLGMCNVDPTCIAADVRYPD